MRLPLTDGTVRSRNSENLSFLMTPDWDTFALDEPGSRPSSRSQNFEKLAREEVYKRAWVGGALEIEYPRFPGEHI